MTLKYSLSGTHWILNKYMLNKINEGGHLIILGRLHDQIGKKKVWAIDKSCLHLELSVWALANALTSQSVNFPHL